MLYEVITKKSGADVKDSMPNPELQQTAWERIIDAVDGTLANLYEVKVPAEITATTERRAPVPNDAPDFRITSYNVCYTKLLRRRQSSFAFDNESR